MFARCILQGSFIKPFLPMCCSTIAIKPCYQNIRSFRRKGFRFIGNDSRVRLVITVQQHCSNTETWNIRSDFIRLSTANTGGVTNICLILANACICFESIISGEPLFLFPVAAGSGEEYRSVVWHVKGTSIIPKSFAVPRWCCGSLQQLVWCSSYMIPLWCHVTVIYCLLHMDLVKLAVET